VQFDDLNKVYLGDSVYASFDGFMIKLCTNNGERDQNPIWFEQPVMQNLINYIVERRHLASFLPIEFRALLEKKERERDD
jgi:hypothetical protein